MVKVTLLYFDDCPSWQTADGHLRALADEVGYTAQATHSGPGAWPSAGGAGLPWTRGPVRNSDGTRCRMGGQSSSARRSS